MLFFTSGRASTLRRLRRDPGSWLDAASSVDAESAMKDAGAAMRHAGGDIAEAARDVGAEAARQIRASAEAARDIGTRQIRANAAAIRAGAAAVPDDLLPAGRDAIGKSI